MDKKLIVEKVNKTTSGDIDTFRSFSKIYNDISEECFSRCVWDFGTTIIRDKEERCISKCTTNYMQMAKVLGDSFSQSQVSNITTLEE